MSTPNAAAQAGGGGSFGGSGGGSGGGGEAVVLELLIYLLRFTVAYPQFGIPIWIVLGMIAYYVTRQEKALRVSRTIRRGRKTQEDRLRDTAIDDIKQRDPAFYRAVFLQRVNKGFLLTQQAWSDQQLQRCRAFISDGVYERFKLYVAMQKAENVRNRMRDIEVLSCKVVAVTCDRHFDTIHVEFRARAISFNEDLTTGKRVGGNSDKARITFTEVWSFSRRTGVATRPEAALLQGNCPNCGAMLEISDVAKCEHCESQVNSGQYDWVLSEITQAEEWVVPPTTHVVPGWAALLKTDPALNFQHLEDRGSVMFWRCIMATYFDDFGYAAPVLASERKDLPAFWHLPKGQFWKTPAVGSVQVSRATPATQNDPFDRVYVLIRWSARRAEGDPRRSSDIDRQRIYSHVMVLKRRTGAQTKIDQAFASFNCHNCAAPIEIGKATVCHFCETTLNDGALDWVLDDVKPFSAAQYFQREDSIDRQANAGAGVERLADDRFINEPELLGALARMAMADGVLDEKERKYIERLAKRRGVSKVRLARILRAADAQEQPIRLPDNKAEADVFVDHLVRAALLDGYISRGERKLLHGAVKQLGWTDAQLDAEIERSREELYRQAKKILKKKR